MKRYLESPLRDTSKAERKAFAERVKGWGQTVQGKPAKAAWASELLADFAGKETFAQKGKKALDPAVEVLCKLAGRDPPALDGK